MTSVRVIAAVSAAAAARRVPGLSATVSAAGFPFG